MIRRSRRTWDRLCVKKDINAKLTVDYMGEKLDAELLDISSDGIGFLINNEPNSIIDYDIAMLSFETEDQRFNHPARVLYSQKVNTSGRSRRYGAFFMANNDSKLESFLDDSCEPYKRERRADNL